ncbi:MAG: EAL domain-containing protein [Methylococcales bacterium]|nr:EAL domain-containing protein [Methylococcales bacterium]
MSRYISKKYINQTKSSCLAISILTSVLIFCVGWFEISRYESGLVNEQRDILKNELTIRADKLAEAIKFRLSLLPGIKAFISTNQDLYKTNPQEFERTIKLFLKNIYGNVSHIRSISISPDGGQRYTFPDTDFDLTNIELKVFTETQPDYRAKIQQIIESKEISISTPSYLDNEEELIMTVRLAIYQNNIFWGLITMELNIDPIISEANLLNIKNRLFQFSLRAINENENVFYGDEKSFEGNPITYDMKLPASQWEISIVRSEELGEFSLIPLSIINFLCASLMGSLLYIFLARNKYVESNSSEIDASVKPDHEVLSAVFQALPDLYFRTAKDGTILDYRASQLDKFHVDSEKFLNLKMQEVLPPDIGSIFEEQIEQYTKTKQLQTFEYTLQTATGKYDYEARLTGFPDSDDLIIVIREVTERKKSEELIWNQANYDPLTRLPNRRMLHNTLKQEIVKSGQSNHALALLFIDLDRFKDVNDHLGHDMGDELLIESAKRIVNCIRESDIVARFGGDEFTVILAELDELHSVERIARKIIKSLSDQFLLGKNLANISASIGISIFPNDAKDAYGLLKNADMAMYQAKALGRSRFSYFTMSMQQEAKSRLIILNDMHKALVENQFQLYFQPIIDLETNKVYKAEALIRWNHPTVGLVEPDFFIALAEDTGLITDIGNWVFKKAAQQVKKFKENENFDVQISINKSPMQFQKARNLKKWLKYLKLLNLSGENLAIEITEGSLIENDANINWQLSKFREIGLQVSLDDFGTGYSSLSYLKKFDIDYIKLDQSFISNLKPNSEDMALSEAIIVMAHKLDLKVIAEGIETEQQMQLLVDMKCDYGQGYLIAKPLPADEFIKFLSNNNRELYQNPKKMYLS